MHSYKLSCWNLTASKPQLVQFGSRYLANNSRHFGFSGRYDCRISVKEKKYKYFVEDFTFTFMLQSHYKIHFDISVSFLIFPL